ncbi:hypothetical protein [Mucilaginibacter sp. UYCu711]|uniref:hypothetical protein n=1 Tax=Mucilaginibacter sp. UYCu711 TaxID=3156339 RepID=UPI003D1BB867
MLNQTITTKQKLYLVYLWLVPVIAAAVGFGIGPVSYKIFLPVWVLNVCIMIIAAYQLGAQRLWAHSQPGRQLVVTALLLSAPWFMFSIFAGMGPPPATVQGWVNSADEQ